MTEYDDELMKLGARIDRRVRCLLIDCADCDLKVIRVERDTRERREPGSHFGADYTYGGLKVFRDGARHFRKYKPGAMNLNPTYSWQCKCGRKDSRRHEKILRAWPQHLTVDGVVDPTAKPPRVLHLKLGVDL